LFSEDLEEEAALTFSIILVIVILIILIPISLYISVGIGDIICIVCIQNKTKAYLCAADSKRSDKYGLTDISNKSNKWWFEDFSNKLKSKSNSKCCQKSIHWFDKYCKWKQCVLECQLRNWFLKLKSYSVMIWKIILHFKSLLRIFIQIKKH
jgi:hypothetical protein